MGLMDILTLCTSLSLHERKTKFKKLDRTVLSMEEEAGSRVRIPSQCYTIVIGSFHGESLRGERLHAHPHAHTQIQLHTRMKR